MLSSSIVTGFRIYVGTISCVTCRMLMTWTTGTGLQSCTSLQKFSFTPAYWDAAQVLLIDRALQQLHSPSLTHLSFSFCWCSAAEPEQRARGTALGTILDDRFSTDPFRNLMKVTIKIQIFGVVPSNAEIAKYFPRTLKRGILRLEIEREPAND